jgi:Pro-kumamolisin, activation domain/Bacterial Ig-like domain (group 3)
MSILRKVFSGVAKSLLLAILAGCLSSTLSHAAAQDRISGALSSGQGVTLAGNVHHKALPQFDEGPVDPAMRLGTITLVTAPTVAQRNALTQLLKQQRDGNSSNFHKWLTPEQYADRFGLSQNDAQKISTWLKAQGFGMVQVARGRNWVSFTGTAAQVQNAFGTEIHRYNLNGELHYANPTPPMIPAALAGIVTGMRGLNDFHPKPMGVSPSTDLRPTYDDPSLTPPDLVAPGDIATIYDINALYTAGIDGTGEKLAVMGQTDIYLADIADFRSGFGLSAISCTTNSSGVITACADPHFQYVLDGADPGLSTKGDIKEADLDLEWAGAVARGAQLIYVNSTSTIDSYYYAIDHNLAPVISLSYGECEYDDNTLSADELELQKANSLGITFVNSSGDSGVAECDYFKTVTNTNLATEGLAVSYPASSPEVTGVGGTAISFTNLTGTYWGTSNGTYGGTALSYIPEQAWNDDAEFYQYCQVNSSTSFCQQGGSTAHQGWVPITSEATAQTDIGIASSGGGASNCSVENGNSTQCVSGFAQPSWQTVSITGQTSARFSPDVSFLASPNFPGYILCTQLSELGLSGSGSSCSPGGTAGITNALNLNARSITGGTSVSAPLFAGIVTLLNQYLAGASSPGLGNVNPTLYALAQTPANEAFHPVTTGDNNVSCEIGTPSNQPSGLQCPSSGVFGYSASNADATTGFNLVTGLGSVDVDKLAIAWAGSRASSSVALTPTPAQAYQTENVTLTAAVTPSSADGSVTFNNGSTALGTATLSGGSAAITVSTLPVATNNITATYNGDGALSNSTSTAATVTVAPAFTLSSTVSTLNIIAGQNGTATITVAPATGFSKALTFSCSGLPTGATCSFSPNNTTQDTVTLTVTTLASMGSSSSTLTITATSGGTNPVSNTLPVTLVVTPAFSIASNPATVTVVAGQTGSATITVTAASGFNQSLTFGCSGLPSGASCTFTPNNTTQTTIALSIATGASTVASSTPITITASTGGTSSSISTIQITLTVTGVPGFSLAPSVPTVTVTPGQSGSANITVTPTNGFSQALTYSCVGLPSLSSCAFTPNNTAQTTVVLSVTTTAPTTAKVVRPFGGMGIFYAALLPGLGIFLTSRKRRRGMLGALLMLGLLTLCVGCGGSASSTGGGTSNPGTPAGSYTVTVNATTGGASAMTNSTSFMLVVQ